MTERLVALRPNGWRTNQSLRLLTTTSGSHSAQVETAELMAVPSQALSEASTIIAPPTTTNDTSDTSHLPDWLQH
jgi:hypothetical protein